MFVRKNPSPREKVRKQSFNLRGAADALYSKFRFVIYDT